MQCANCDFENMPGITTCARCDSALTFGSAAVEPPRASKHRLGTRVRRLFHPVWNRLSGLRLTGRRLTLLLPEPISASALAWSIVPGLVHLRIRQPRLGWSLLCIWLTFLLLTLLSFGTFWCSFFWTGAIATHVVALVSMFAADLSYERLLMRALFGAAIFAALHLMLYRPITYTCSRVYFLWSVPSIGVNQVAKQGDVLLFEGPWIRPERFNRGDLVAYRINEQQGDGYYIPVGFNFDRVIGTPGDHVQAIDGALLVNGERLAGDLRPLAAARLGNFELNVRPGHYLILPTCLDVRLGATSGVSQQLLVSASIVGHEDVLGRVVFRLRPLNRLGSVR